MNRRVLIPTFALALGACTVGPDYRAPAPPAHAAYLPGALPAAPEVTGVGPAGAAQHFLEDRAPERRWWLAFGSPALDALVEQALLSNPSVQAAQAAVREANEATAAQRGSFWPQLSADAAAARQRNAIGVLSPTLASGSAVFSLLTPQLLVSFVPDVFGANRRAVESLAAQAEAARDELDATYVTLIDNVIAAGVQIAGLVEQITATERIVALERESLGILQHSLALGAVSQADVSAQETAVAQAEAMLPPLRHQLAVERHALAVLCGRLPSDGPPFDATLDALRLPGEIPLGVPSTLIERRPDVRAAAAGLHAATAEVGVATANLLPTLTITGGAGSTATRATDLFRSGSSFWSAGADLSQTLFAGGTLVHKKAAAVAAMDAAAASYRATVLTAFQNVADALHALGTDAELLADAARAAGAAETGFDIARRQLKLGAIAYPALLLSEQNYLQTKLALISAKTNRFLDTAALLQALGGAGIGAGGTTG